MTREEIIQKTTKEFLKWVGYTEKGSSSAIRVRTYENPGPYNENAGFNNYTVFAKLYKEKTGIDVQGQPWCDTFVDTVLIHLFGVDTAKKMLNEFSAYTPTSAQNYVKADRWSTVPKEGAQIFFKKDSYLKTRYKGIYHTGYVYKVDANNVYTVEGNTSTAAGVEANGGGVAKKQYPRNYAAIAGYGMPDYDLVSSSEPKVYQEGWMKAADNKRWWYQFKDGSYARNDGKNDGWYQLETSKGKFWFLFDANGYMLTGKQKVSGRTYLLADSTDEVEGALMHTNTNDKGYQEIWKL